MSDRMRCVIDIDTWVHERNTTVHRYNNKHTHNPHTTLPQRTIDQPQITCLLLLLLLKVADLSTAFLMLLTFCTISLATFGFSASKSYLFVPPSLCTTSLKDEEFLADCWQATTDLMWYEDVRPVSNIPVARLADGIICWSRVCDLRSNEDGNDTYVEVSAIDRQNSLVSSHKHGQLPGDNIFLGYTNEVRTLCDAQDTTFAPCKHPCNPSQKKRFVPQEFRTSS